MCSGGGYRTLLLSPAAHAKNPSLRSREHQTGGAPNIERSCWAVFPILIQIGPLSRLQCWGSVKFWCGSGSGSPDPYLWLIDPDPTPFFIDFNFLLKFCVKTLFCSHYFSPLYAFMRKGKDPEPDPDPHLRLWIRIREAPKHADPVDPEPVPDPQHCPRGQKVRRWIWCACSQQNKATAAKLIKLIN